MCVTRTIVCVYVCVYMRVWYIWEKNTKWWIYLEYTRWYGCIWVKRKFISLLLGKWNVRMYELKHVKRIYLRKGNTMSSIHPFFLVLYIHTYTSFIIIIHLLQDTTYASDICSIFFVVGLLLLYFVLFSLLSNITSRLSL